jgi:hypothetical protein
MKRQARFQIAAVASFLAVTAARADTVFTDDTFSPTNWTLSVFSFLSGGSVTAAQEQSGGNPGEYRRIMNTVNGGSAFSTVYGFHKNVGAVYLPKTQGPIGWIDYSEDSILLIGFGEGQGGGAALEQGGQVYVAGSFITPEDAWTHKSLSNLCATCFVRLDPSAPFGVDATSHPDFSGTGGSIAFGFLRSNSSAGGGTGYTIDGGIDNWEVAVRTPLLAAIRVAAVEVCWNARTNTIYEVQFRSELTTNAWITLTNVIGAGATNCIVDWVPSDDPRRFYRVEQK